MLARSISLLALALLVVPVVAQDAVKAPRAGKHYEDAVNLAFKLKAPHGWEVTPSGPEDANLQVKFTPEAGLQGEFDSGAFMPVEANLVLFDTRVTKEVAAERRQIRWSADARSWVTDNLKGKDFEPRSDEEDRAELKTRERDLAATETVLAHGSRHGEVLCYMANFPLDEFRTLAFIATAPGGKEGRRWLKAYNQMARSFERVKREEIKAPRDARNLDGPRKEKYDRLVRELPTAGGWAIHTSDNYFIVTDCPEIGFIRKIQRRLEAIRQWYERDFPLERAYVPKPQPTEITLPEGFEELPPEEQAAVRKQLEEASQRSISDGMDGLPPDVRSRMCVVKVFKDRAAYLKYGAPPQSAGYWWGLTEELCLYDDPKDRDRTLNTLFHEAFHQYMHYYCAGELRLHGWFNEGNADFYGGYIYLSGQIRPKESDTREAEIKAMLRSGKYAPTATFITWYQREYYGTNELDIDISSNYAHGWSFVNLLQRGSRERPRGWKSEWGDILSTYLRVAFETGDPDKALEAAFENVDLDALEECWRGFVG
ncbi:MAG: hypothetical protein WD226_13370 [Planctomycetota bacterium]